MNLKEKIKIKQSGRHGKEKQRHDTGGLRWFEEGSVAVEKRELAEDEEEAKIWGLKALKFLTAAKW